MGLRFTIYFICDEESSTSMTRVQVLWSFLKEENRRAGIGMIRQSIAREDVKCDIYARRSTYEYMIRLPCEFVRMIHGFGDHAVGRLWNQSSAAGIGGYVFNGVYEALILIIRIFTRNGKNVRHGKPVFSEKHYEMSKEFSKHRILSEKTIAVRERYGRSMMDASS